MKTKLMVLYGFLVGVLLLVIANGMTLIVYLAYLGMSGDVFQPFYGVVVLVIVWFIEVLILKPYGSVPLGRTASAFFTISTFVWGPVFIGLLIAFHMNMLGLWVGFMISATFVGYNIVVTMDRSRKIHLRRG